MKIFVSIAITSIIFFKSAFGGVPPTEILEKQFKMLMLENSPTFVIANAGPIYSYDPLEGLNLRNSRVLQLLYSRPIEMDLSGNYFSEILDNFSYDQKSKTVSLTMKKKLIFSDKTKITLDDLVLSIKRNALKRPTYPPVRDLQGIAEWRQKKNPLQQPLEGIKIDRVKQRIDLVYTKDQKAPFEKLSMTTFGIIPGKCVDLKSNNLSCDIPPSSGKYIQDSSFLEKSKQEIFSPTFLKFKSRGISSDLAPTIWVAYMSPSRIINYVESFNEKTVVVVNEIDIPSIQKKTLLAKMKLQISPKIMYSFLELNPYSTTFKDIRVRQYFAKKYRETLSESDIRAEGSQMTNIVLGYLSLKTLENDIKPFSTKEEQAILAHLRKNPPKWMKTNQSVYDPFSIVFAKTMAKLSVDSNIVASEEYSGQHQDLWDKGVISIRPGYSTMGPVDPTNDIKTVFTPNLHRFLNFVTEDKKLQELVLKLTPTDRLSHENLNRYLFTQSKFAVTANFSRLFLVSKDNKNNYPFRLHEPEVWMFYASKK